jgi:hypothetical protein
MVGDVSMLDKRARKISEDILNKKGIIIKKSVEEKYDEIFSKYTNYDDFEYKAKVPITITNSDSDAQII